ncbi:MAG: hypothetical protein KGI71_04590 [Patescibacteria group bacterium]|nr:hypothetical protein [Patescibacteria group bacterium]
MRGKALAIAALLALGVFMISSGVYAAIPPPCDQFHGCFTVSPPPQGPATTTTQTQTTSTTQYTTTTTPPPSACGPTGCPLYTVSIVAMSAVTSQPIPGAYFNVKGSDGAYSYACCGGADSSGTWTSQKYAGSYAGTVSWAGYATQTFQFTVTGTTTLTVTLQAASTTSVYPYGLQPTFTSSAFGTAVTWTLLKATDALCVLGGQAPGCGASGSTAHLMTLYSASPAVTSCGWNLQQGGCLQVNGQQCWQQTGPNMGTTCFASLAAPAGTTQSATWAYGGLLGSGSTVFLSVGYYPDVSVVASVFGILASALSPASSLPLIGGGTTPAAILMVLGIVPLAGAYMLWKRR